MLVPVFLSSLALAAPLPAAPPAPRFEVGQTVQVGEEVSDIFAAGETVTVKATVHNNAFLTGELLRVEHPIQGDLFAAGETLHIDAPVHGNVYVAAGEVLVGPEGHIGGHLRVASGELTIAGPVHGTVSAGAGRVTIQAEVGGDVNVEAGELIVGPDGHLYGDLTYSTPDVAAGVDDATEGAIDWTESVDEEPEEVEEHGLMEGVAGWWLWLGWGFFSKLIVGAAVLMLGGASAGRVGRVLRERPAQSLGFGMAGMILVPLLSVLACIMVVPLPLGVLAMMAFGALLYVGQLISAQALGDEILRRFRPGALGRPMISMSVGLLPLVLLSALPWLGDMVWFLATMMGAGALWLWSREAVAE